MTYEEALKKVDGLSIELDENGYTSILILEANGCRNLKAMRATHPEHKPEFIKRLLVEAYVQIEHRAPEPPVRHVNQKEKKK